MKNTSTLILRNSLLLLATLFTFSSLPAVAQTKLAAPRISQAINEANLVPMHSKVHPLARAEFDRGVVADSQPMNRMILVLQRSPEQETALRNLMDEQQTKNSPNYHAWLTPTQFGQQFGVADADVQKVTAWLAQKGFTGIKTTPGNMFVEFSGTAAAVRNAFHTDVHQFMVKGEMHMANVSVPQIPAALAPVVRGIHSLHTFRKKSFMHFSKALEQAKAKARADGTQFTYANVCPNPGTPTQGTQPCAAVGPADFAKIYNLPSNLDGTGQTIALVARSNIAVSDINQFGTGFGISNLSNFSAANNIVLTGPDPGIMVGDDAEATLDVEWSGAVAPKAKILLVVSDTQASTFIDGVDLSAIYIVVNNLAQIMSESFGSCEVVANDGLESALWEQAASQGITVMVSTGDNGSAGCDPDQTSGNFTNASDAGLQISGTASTPFNVAVGGTDFDDATNPSTYWTPTNSGTGLLSAKSYIPEITWNGGCASTATAATLNTVCSSIDPNDPNGLDLSAGSGGQSNCGLVDNLGNCLPYPKPVWQQLTGLTGMPQDSARDIPDVSLFAAVNTASNHFYIICLADSALQNGQPCSLTGSLNFSGVGGTSASSPAFAGIIALVNQSEVTAGRLKAGEGQGNVNYVLYKLAVAQDSAPGASACNSSTGPNASCTFNDITKGNNSVPCVGSFPAGNPSVLNLLNTPNCSTQAANAIGVLVEPSSPTPFNATTPGFTTTAGYDLATGLGSMNVSNLVANWGNVTTNFKTSTATITSTSPVTLNALSHGQNVTFNVSVTSGSGTPTGDVTLVPAAPLATNGTIFANLSNTGTASIVTNQLPGGTYPVVIHYAGDGTFAASDSAPITVTVSKENSTAASTMWEYWNFPSSTQLAPASAPYGSQYLFRVDVIGSQNQDNQQCSAATVTIPCPTGKVTFTADGSPLNDFLNTATGVSTNSALLNPQGFVEDRVLGSTGLKAGAHSIVASYAGDNSYNASAAPALAITITPASTQTAVSAAVSGQPVTTVQAGQQVSLVANVGTATPLPGGGLATSNGAGPTGSVTFSACGTAGSCMVTVVPTAASNTTGAAFATATLPTTFTTVGTQNITATFTSGDGNYNSCTTPVNTATQLCTLTALNLTVTLPPSKVAFTVQPSNVAAGASITPPVQVSVEDSSGNVVTTATNPVTIAIANNAGPGGVLSGTLTATPVNGVATFSNLSINKAGTGYTLMAGATGLTSATSSAFNVTAPVPAKLAFTVQPSNVAINTSITPAVQVSVEDGSGNVVTTATNAITIAIGTNPGTGTLSGTATANAVAGVATFSNLSINQAGTGYTLMASATGLTSATSTAFNVTSGPAGFAVSYSPQPLVLSSATGAAATLTVTVTPAGGFMGTVAVTPTAATLPPGVTCTPSPLNINVTTAAAVNGQLMCSVTATSTTLTASNAREDRMFEARAVSPANAIPPTTGGKGWWALSAGTGFAALFLMFLPGGRKKYRAALGLGLVCILSLTMGCSGNGGGGGITKTATVTKLTVTSGKVLSPATFSFSVAVTGGTPTGQVQLFDGATMIGTAATVSGGVATPTAPALSVGTHAISAHYLGDTTTLASASGTLNLTEAGSTTIAITTTPAATPVAPAINVTIN